MFEGCVGVDFNNAPGAPCIPAAATNCVVKSLATSFTNFTSDDPELPFRWICSGDLVCGIATLDTNSTSGALGAINGSATFGSTNSVVGFVDSGSSIVRKVGPGVIGANIEYVFSFDVCLANATTMSQYIRLSVDIANANGVVVSDIAFASVTLDGIADQSSCGSALLRIPPDLLVPHIGIDGFTVTIQNIGFQGARAFIDNVLVQVSSTATTTPVSSVATTTLASNASFSSASGSTSTATIMTTNLPVPMTLPSAIANTTGGSATVVTEMITNTTVGLRVPTDVNVSISSFATTTTASGSDDAFIGGIVGGVLVLMLFVVGLGCVILVRNRQRRVKNANENNDHALQPENANADGNYGRIDIRPPPNYQEYIVAAPTTGSKYDILLPNEIGDVNASK